MKMLNSSNFFIYKRIVNFYTDSALVILYLVKICFIQIETSRLRYAIIDQIKVKLLILETVLKTV